MHLVDLTLQDTERVQHLLMGHFSGNSRVQEMVKFRGPGSVGHDIELWRPDPNELGKYQCILRQPTYGTVLSAQSFPFSGSTKEYIEALNTFEKVAFEEYGRTGIRRTVAGRYLSVDPKGRAAMIGALEKQKFVFVFNRESKTNPGTNEGIGLTLSSPLEAHKNRMLTQDIVALDVGFDNPLFAALELPIKGDVHEDDDDDFDDQLDTSNSEMLLTYYELDLGLNHVIRKHQEKVDPTAYKLVALPEESGVKGLLVITRTHMVLKRMDQEDITVEIPCGISPESDEAPFVACHSLHASKTLFLLLFQLDNGALLRLVPDPESPTAFRLSYFDRVPLCRLLGITKTGFIFCFGERTDDSVYQIVSLDEITEETLLQYGAEGDATETAGKRNLLMIEQFPRLNNVIDVHVATLPTEEDPVIITATRDSLKVLRRGIEVVQLAALPGLPADCENVWTHEDMIILAFGSSTVVMKMTDDSVEEISTGDINRAVRTIAISRCWDGSFIQVHGMGFRHLNQDGTLRTEWKSPQKIHHVVANDRILLISYGTSLLGFIIDAQLIEISQPHKFAASISALALSSVPSGQLYSNFLAVGFEDDTLRILKIEYSSGHLMLDPICIQVLPAVSSSLSFFQTQLVVGLVNGLCYTFQVQSNGVLDLESNKYLGADPVALVAVQDHLLAVSGKTYLIRKDGFRATVQSVFVPAVKAVNCLSFVSNSVIAIHAEEQTASLVMYTLQISPFQTTSIPLDLPPRRIVPFVNPYYILLLCTDHVRSEAIFINIVTFEKTVILAVEGGLMSGAFCNALQSHSNETFLFLNHVQDFDRASSFSSSVVRSYKVDLKDNTIDVSLLHDTPVSHIVHAYQPFYGRLLVGIGPTLRLYDLGKKQLLRKSEITLNARCINFIATPPSRLDRLRVFVGDATTSLHMLLYQPEDNVFLEVIDDPIPRPLQSAVQLDSSTTAGTDRLGNFFILRVDPRLDADLDSDKLGFRVLDKARLLSASNKFQLECHSYSGGDIFIKLTHYKGALLYVTLFGRIGIFLPLKTLEDVNCYQRLEMLLRNQTFPNWNLANRDLLSYKSYYSPVKNVIDFNILSTYLIDQESLLSYEKKVELAEMVDPDLSPLDLQKKLATIQL